MDCSPPGSSVCGVSQARIPEWVAIPFSKRSSWPKDQTQVFCIAGKFFTVWATSMPFPQLFPALSCPSFHEKKRVIFLNFSFIGVHNHLQIGQPHWQNSLNMARQWRQWGRECADCICQLLFCNKQAYEKSQWHKTKSIYLAPASSGQLYTSRFQLD